MNHAEEYFATARERYLIKLRRENGQAWPWTDDVHFRDWRFCNVHREDDKTTAWFRENIRSKLSGQAVIRATIIFRWFNRIESAEKILDLILGEWDSKEAYERLKNQDRIVTGAYIISSPTGMEKLEGVLYCIDKALPQLESVTGTDLETFWNDIRHFYYLGPFLAYEVVSDLRWTDVLKNATDINTWANPGPGCSRGLGRVMSGTRDHFSVHGGNKLEVMRELFSMAQDVKYWPWADEAPWEMREVEHWACEYEKYCAAVKGRRLKRRYRESSSG